MTNNEQLSLLPEEPLELTTDQVDLQSLSHIEVQVATKQLLDSIKNFGIAQPILLREKDGRYDIVDGRRRLDCARRAGHLSIPAVIAHTGLAIADVMTLALNATRTSNAIAEYDAITRLTTQGASLKEVAAATGMNIGTIKARQRLFNLDKALLEGFRAGQITVTVAEAAAKLPQAIQQELAATFFADEKLTMTDVHEARRARTQQAMAQMEPFDFGPDDDGEPIDARTEEPPEFDQANRLTQLADEIDPRQGVLIRSLRWCAALLMDIATGQQNAQEYTAPPLTGRPVVGDPVMPGGEWARGGAPYPYAMGQGIASDAAPNDAPVAEPNRVFTVTKIEEPVEEAFYEEPVEEPEEPEDADTSDEEPYPAEQADDERYPGNWMNEVFER